MGMFDDLIAAVPQQSAPPPSTAQPSRTGMFDDLIAQHGAEGPTDNPAFRQAYELHRQFGGPVSEVVRGIPVVGGLAQKAAAGINSAIGGTPYQTELDAMRAADEAFAREHPKTATALQLGGGTMATLGLAGGAPGGLALAPRATLIPPGGAAYALPRAVSGGAPNTGSAVAREALGGGGTTLPGRMLRSGASGAGLGAADAYTRDQGAGEGAALGGALGAAGPLVGRMVGAAANRMSPGPGLVPGRGAMGPSQPSINARSVAPTEEALFRGGDTGFNAARASDLVVHPAGVADLSNIIEHDLLNGAPGAGSFHPDQASEAFQALRDMRQAPPATSAGRYGTAPQPTTNTDANGLINLRERLAAAAGSPDPREAKAASYALDRFDNYMESIPNHHVLSGDVNAFRTNYAEGRANHAAAKRSERFSQDVLENASRNADVAHAGENKGNTTRQRLNAYIKSNQRGTELGRGANEAEIAAADKVARGTGFANAARKVQSYTGGLKRGTVASLLGTGAALHFGLPWEVGAAAPHVVSEVARRAAEASTLRGARGIDEQLRLRSPLGAQASAARAQAAATNDAAMRRGALASRVAQTPIAQMLQEQFQ